MTESEGQGQGGQPSSTMGLKVVVRMLPPELTEDVFRKQVEDFAGDTGEVQWMRFWRGDLQRQQTASSSARSRGEASGSASEGCSRCYVKLRDHEAARKFHGAFHGHAYVTDRGHEFRATVSVAPNQRCPKGRKKRDPKENTIEKDGDYKRFLASLEEDSSSQRQPPPQQQQQQAEDLVVTPLMAYMRKKAAQRAAGAKKRRKKGQDKARKAKSNNKNAKNKAERERELMSQGGFQLVRRKGNKGGGGGGQGGESQGDRHGGGKARGGGAGGKGNKKGKKRGKRQQQQQQQA